MTATATIPSIFGLRARHDAVDLLVADHDELATLFGEYERTYSWPNRKALVDTLCAALLLHTQLEEEIFYPEVRLAMKDHLLVPTAEVEHATIRGLIDMLQSLDVGSATYQAAVGFLSRFVTAHIIDEEQAIFQPLRTSTIDLSALGDRLVMRKAALLATQHAAQKVERVAYPSQLPQAATFAPSCAASSPIRHNARR